MQFKFIFSVSKEIDISGKANETGAHFIGSATTNVIKIYSHTI
jgi:hypothetical protein